ncbi:diguanylate cyclase [Arcobacter sp. s6]|uniref:diguanylate cyclase n=1 Tax=Arcobacter sp. s6 TaxID=3230363 RepID=UPI0034A053B9
MKNKNLLISLIILLVISFTSFIIKYTNDTKNEYQVISKNILFQQSSTLFNNIVTMRQWSSDHGAVYVKSHEGIEPNPYLENNHTYTKDNELLIKINPAWMTRQLSEMSNKAERYYFKITSLDPINPINIPDEFEQKALNDLEKNKEKKFYTNIEKDMYNLLGSLKVEPSCLECHAHQNYKVGDIIGGLRVSVPIDSYVKNMEILQSKTNFLYTITIITAIVFIFIIIFTINSIYSREKSIVKLNNTLEKKVNKRTKELSDANKKLLEISTKDYLTNIANRRYFFEIGLKSLHIAKRENSDLSIVCIDIDFFKNINDTYGHNIGDEILKLIANNMNKYIRKSDILARIGGEEFVILLNNTNEQNAYALAEKIRVHIESLIYKNDKIEIRTSISMGISQLRAKDDDLDSIIIRADKALYEAKNTGRNKSVIFG